MERNRAYVQANHRSPPVMVQTGDGVSPWPGRAYSLPWLAETILDLDLRDLLPHIASPGLAIGETGAGIIRTDIQREIARLIPRSQIVLYPGQGHGNYLENPDNCRESMHS